MIDYATELEALRRKFDLVTVDEAIRDCRRGSYVSPVVMGELWSAIDLWVAAGRPSEGFPVRLNHRSPWVRLMRATAAYCVTAMWSDIFTPAEKTPTTGGIEK